MFDIVYVSYNSAKWIDKCFESWLKIDYDLKNINIIVVDNNSTDETVELLQSFKKKEEDKFNSFTILPEQYNWGFGKANNIGFANGTSPIVCFLNIDTEMFPDTMKELEKDINNSDNQVGLWEFRQFPYEHPKMYDVLTGETTWSSGAAFAVRRTVYEQVGGFDEKIFMYAEDVDLSWRIRSEGYILKYAPRVKIMHYSYETAGEIKPNQHIYSVVNNLLLRYRFANTRTILLGHMLFWNLMRVHEAFPGSKKMLLKQYWKHFRLIPHFRAKGKYKRNKNSVGYFSGWDYCMIRDGAFYENFLPHEKPLVSIIVRTCGRPSVLRETLISLRKQTYDNIEIVIVEDGKPISESMIREEFSDLNILYQATDEKVGRSKAGNLAMTLAHGKYLNFLDDDDLFYADHVEVLVANIEKSGKQAAYATSYETPVEVKSKEPYIYAVKSYLGIHKQPFDKIILCHHNYIPIQCIMFSKTLFEQYGGLDETVDALEDWDMWVRYSLHTDFAFVLKTTSIYRVPAVRDINAKRQKELDDALVVMREKHKGYQQNISVYDIAKMYETR
jgi:GT2 family glycosyltransferase